jgi:dipeptidyl-peptidase-3
MNAGKGLLRIIHSGGTDGEPYDLRIKLDRSLISTVGRTAIADLILHLQTFRCTADVKNATPYFNELTNVDGDCLIWRKAVESRQPKRFLFVQGNIFMEDGRPELKEYPATKEGLIQSWGERARELGILGFSAAGDDQ